MAADAKKKIVIVRKKKVSGGGHHGSSWKVAYADRHDGILHGSVDSGRLVTGR